MGSSIRMLAAVLVAVVGTWAAGVATAAAAEFEISEFGVAFADADGVREMEPGAHADLTTTVRFPTTLDSGGNEIVVENPKDIVVDTPPGVIGDPTNFPSCSSVDFANRFEAACDQDTQIGKATITLGLGFGPQLSVPAQIYNLDPPQGVAARFGFNLLGVITVLDGVVDAKGRYHIRVRSLEISQGLGISKVAIQLWGVPTDSGHDDERGACIYGGSSCPSDLEPVAFMSNPTSCSQTPLEFHVSARSWQNPARLLEDSTSDDTFGEPLRFTGCSLVPFDPEVRIEPTSHTAGQPTGMRVEMSMPPSDDPGGTAQANLRDAVVTLPEGMTISPPSAAGLATCSDAELGLGSTDPSTCPDASKIGTARLQSPVLEEPLTGGIYLRPQASADPESGEMYRLAIELANADRGVDLKLPGSIRASRSDGRLVTTFADNPQLPFSNLQLDFKSGPRAPLVNPPSCGRPMATARLTSWSGAEVTRANPVAIDAGCGVAPFTPSLEAGTANPVAGEPSPFTLRVTRPDGQPNLASIDATLPEGVLARLAGVPVCADAAAATGDCPAASQVGTASVGVGAGSNPIYVPQPGKAPTGVYLAGPYRGAPYSLAVKVPAQAGPFDLGTVTVRNALFVDPVTTQVTTKSDPLPQILGGIPISYRDIRVEITRPDFTLNPTSCAPMAVTATVGSAAGGVATPSNRFQVGSCERLGFKPKLALRLSGPTRRAAHPALKAVLTMPKGGANIAKAVVTLPKTELLENAHIRTICTRVQYAADQCPKGSVYGYAKAWTPLLDQPLQGPVYLRSSTHKLPDLFADLNGQIEIDLAGRIDSPNGRIRNTFWAVPDAPVSKFVLTMQGGRKSLLANNTELCEARPRAKTEFTGQNGKSLVSNPLVKVDCGKGAGNR